MAEYQYTSDPNIFRRTADGVSINASGDINGPDNLAFHEWLSAGGVPDPNPTQLADPDYSWGPSLAEFLGD